MISFCPPSLPPSRVLSTVLKQHHAKALQLLGAIEGPARLWPRDRLELGLLPPVDGDDGIIGVDRLHKAAVASLNPAESHDTIGFGIRCLSALGELCLELECSERLGLIGGHHTVLRLMTEGCCVSRDRDARRLQKEKSLNSAPPEQQGQQPHNGNCCCIPVHLAGTGAAGDDATSARGETVTAVSGPPAAAADGGDDDDGDDCEKQEGEEDEVQSAAALVAAHVVSSGSSFPMRPSFHAADGPSVTGRFPLRYDFVVADSTSTSTSSPAVHCTSTTPAAAVPDGSVMAASGLVLEEPSEGCLTAAAVDACTTTTSVRQHSAGDMPGGESISILVRPVNERQHSQFDVGFVMWPAAVILSRLLCRHPEIIRGRRVLEIGAGLGLAGLVAARIQQTPLSAPMVPPEDLAMADCIAVGTSSRSGGCPNLAAGASVTLSDFNPLVLKALEANVALNARSGASTDDAAGEVGKSAGGFRQQSPDSYREGGDSGGTPGRHVCTGAERQAVYVRHLDWDKLNIAPNVVDDCRSGSLGNGDGSDAKVSRRPAGEGAAENGDRCASSERDGDDTDFSPPLNSTDSSGPQCGGMKGIEHGDCFDVIIASDHICQVRETTAVDFILLLAPRRCVSDFVIPLKASDLERAERS